MHIREEIENETNNLQTPSLGKNSTSNVPTSTPEQNQALQNNVHALHPGLSKIAALVGGPGSDIIN